MKICSAILAITALVLFAPEFAQAQQAPAASSSSAESVPSSQPVPRLSDGHPSLNGFWANGFSPDTPAGSDFGPSLPGIKRGDGKRAKAQAADPNQPPYKPELMAKVADLSKNESKDDPAFYCKPGGVPRIGPPHGIIQAPGMPIVFLYTISAGNTFRIIPTDGRPHDPDPEPSYNGDSVGHWEGDTLVIDTVNFNTDTWLGLFGWFHSDAMHVTERISRDGDKLEYQATVEDPKVFTRPWTMNPWTSVYTKDLIIESPLCIETDIKNITSFDEKTKVQ